MTFPQTPLDLRCEIILDGTPTDVSSYVYQRAGTSPPVTIGRGRPDETQQAVPSTCAWEWNNRDGRFSPQNPLGPYYGQIGRNTPVRFSVPSQSNYLRLEAGNSDRAYVSDDSTLHVTGSIEMRIAVRLTDWQGCILAARRDGTTGSWHLYLDDAGLLNWGWWDSGGTFRQVNSDVPVPYTGGDMALRVTMDTSTAVTTFYTAASIDGTYTQLGDPATVSGLSSTSVRAGNCPLVVGYSSTLGVPQLLGRVYEYRLYNGIGGTVVADGVFSAQSAGTTSWTDSASSTWDVAGGGEISSRDYRFHGQMSSLPPRWDVTGRDMAVKAQAGGPLRLISQGTQPPLSSPMKRAILAQSGSLTPVAYWPMEDASGASFFGPAIGTDPLNWNGAPTLATDSSFLCSAPLPAMGGAALQGLVAPYTPTGTWTCRFLASIPTLPASGETELFQVDTLGGLAAYVAVWVGSGATMRLTAYDGNLNVIADTGQVGWGGLTDPQWWSIEAQPSGSNVQYSLVSVVPGASSATGISATSSATGSAGVVPLVAPAAEGGWSDLVIGHVQVQSAWVSLFSLAGPLGAWQGETAAARFARLAGEDGWQARVIGSPAYSAAMGAQGIATLQTLLQECETADLGQIHEPRQCLGLAYRTLASMTAQSPVLALDYSASEPGGVSGDGTDSGLDPAVDDLLSRNDWTVTRGASTGSQGASVRSQRDDGSTMSVSVLGDYADTATVNVESDSQLADVAGWMVHVGTVSEARWPVIPLNLARPEMSALYWQALQLEIGDYLTMDNAPDLVLYDPVRQLMLGTAEALGGFHYTMAFNAVPESPYEVIILDDPAFGRCDTDGSSLASGATSTATTLSVSTASGFPLWTTTAADFPFDIAIAGERITVTSITGTSSPQSFTVTRSVNGVAKAQSSGADVRLWSPPILALE